ncbi:ABC transporter permease [Cellulomonas chitinilytica]|nr:ABC transporter permease [Cellulomonas chitinilytica]
MDLMHDVLVEIHTRRARTTLLVAAIALSTGALVGAVSISRMAAVQIDTDLAATATRTIVVTPASQEGPASALAVPAGAVFPSDAEAAVTSLPLVEAAGLRQDLTTRGAAVLRARDPVDGPEVTGLTVAGVSAGYLDAVELDAVPTAWMLDGTDRVVLLGAKAAESLDVPVSQDPTGHGVWLNGIRYPVVGFLTGDPALSSTVVVPYGLVTQMLGTDAGASLTVLTAPGGAGPVASVVRTAVRPDLPASLATSIVVDAAGARRGVATQLDRLVAWIGGLLLALTMLLIANAMVVAVMSRTPEIGLRRAMGASRRNIASLVLCEGATAGVVGGLAGAALAAVLVVATAVVNGWTARVDPVLLAVAPVFGLAAAALASVYPAARAAAVQPATAVRSD